jgi:hypothetical protein
LYNGYGDGYGDRVDDDPPPAWPGCGAPLDGDAQYSAGGDWLGFEYPVCGGLEYGYCGCPLDIGYPGYPGCDDALYPAYPACDG